MAGPKPRLPRKLASGLGKGLGIASAGAFGVGSALELSRKYDPETGQKLGIGKRILNAIGDPFTAGFGLAAASKGLSLIPHPVAQGASKLAGLASSASFAKGGVDMVNEGRKEIFHSDESIQRYRDELAKKQNAQYEEGIQDMIDTDFEANKLGEYKLTDENYVSKTNKGTGVSANILNSIEYEPPQFSKQELVSLRQKQKKLRGK